MQRSLTGYELQFWNLNHLLESDTAYNIVSCFEIQGSLDIPRLSSAWRRVIDRTGILNVRFVGTDDPCVTDDPPIDIPLVVLEEESRPDAIQTVRNHLNSRFKIESEAPAKCRLISIGNQSFLFLLIIHHIAVDLHTMESLLDLLVEEYNGSISDAVFLEMSEGTIEDRQSAFWNAELSDPPAPLILPSNRTSREPFDGTGDSIEKSMSSELNLRIRATEKNRGYQTFLVMMSAYAALLSRLADSRDFYVGVPFTNRRSDDRKSMLGPFVNILPLHVKIDEKETFASLYASLRKEMLRLHRNQEVPFLELVRSFSADRITEVPYFLQAGMTRERSLEMNLSDLNCRQIHIRPEGAQMDLFFTFWEENEGLHYRWEYNSKAFGSDQIESWMQSFETILDQFLTDDTLQITDGDILGDDYRNRMHRYYSENSRNYPVDTSLRELLLSAYRRSPSEVAIRDNLRELSYDEFRIAVETGSSALNSKVGVSRTIGILIDNSVKRIQTIHSIICSGNQYLPIDPNWPTGRIGYMLEKADAFLVITDDHADRVDPRFPTITTGDLFGSSSAVETLAVSIEASDPVAILYTSGSTGQPKGVCIRGNGIVNRLYWMQEKFPLGPGDTLIHKVPYTFDVSIWEILWPFLFQATLVIPEYGRHLDDEYLAAEIKSQRVSYIHFVPSLLRKFLRSFESRDYPHLRGVICSGEALDPKLVADFQQAVPNTPIFNLYGPTEASIDVTSWDCRIDDGRSQAIPIGYPVTNTRIYILDNNHSICPPYVRGEIAIAGIQLAAGYINSPELTEERFVSGDWGWGTERVYLTGDVGYSTVGIRIYYAGRNDSQVKINGIRIELAEIERRLEKISGIQKAAVMVHDNLRAFLLTDGNPDAMELRRRLSVDLPGYMIPDYFYFRSTFPTNTSGKTDRKALLTTIGQDEADKLPVAGGNSRIRQVQNRFRRLIGTP